MYQICTEKDDHRCIHIKIHRNRACILLHRSPRIQHTSRKLMERKWWLCHDYAIFQYIMPLKILLKQILSFRFFECHHSISSNQSPSSETNLRGHLSEGCGNTFRIQYLRPSKGQKWKLQCKGENVTRLQQGHVNIQSLELEQNADRLHILGWIAGENSIKGKKKKKGCFH